MAVNAYLRDALHFLAELAAEPRGDEGLLGDEPE